MLKGETAGGVPVTSSETKSATHRRIDTLDSYRALAILAVLAFHYTVRWAAPQDPQQHLPDGAIFNGFAPLHYGGFGVEFFFMISGFVILMTLERCRNLGDFVLRRFARLWPALLFAATLSSLVIAWLGPQDWRVSWPDYLTSIALIEPSIASSLAHHPGLKWVDGSYWSLWVEVSFYAWASVIYLVVGRRFVVAWLGLFGVLLAGTILSFWQMPSSVPNLHTGYWLPPYLFLPHFPYFTVGVCGYEVWSNGRFRRAGVCGIGLAILLTAYWIATRQNLYTNMPAIDAVAINFLMFGLFLLFIFEHPTARLFAVRPLVALGQASYSFYLLHQEIGIAVIRRGIALGVPYLVMFPITALAMIALSLAVFRFVEIPGKTWILGRAPGLVKAIDRHLPVLTYKRAVAR